MRIVYWLLLYGLEDFVFDCQMKKKEIEKSVRLVTVHVQSSPAWDEMETHWRMESTDQ